MKALGTSSPARVASVVEVRRGTSATSVAAPLVALAGRKCRAPARPCTQLASLGLRVCGACAHAPTAGSQLVRLLSGEPIVGVQ